MGLKLPKLISDKMVLQRDAKVKIWGFAMPGEAVVLNFAGGRYAAVAGKTGKWEILLPEMKAGGPYVMEIKTHSESVIIKDVLVGDVWVCSGQSNMTIPMERVSVIYEEEMKNCKNPFIRQFSVPDKYDFNAPCEDLDGGSWMAADEDTISDFIAVGYFFAKALFDKYKVPIGLIKSCVGGTPVHSWMSADALKRFPEDLMKTEKLKDDSYIEGIKKSEEEKISTWVNDLNSLDAGLQKGAEWFLPQTDDLGWDNVEIPFAFREKFGNFIGSVWFKKEIDVPSSMAGKPAKLYLGTIVDSDCAYINGVFVGSTPYQYPPRRYEVPAGLLKAGRNVISVRVVSNGGYGEFIPEKPYKLFTEEETIDLQGEWKCKIGAKMDSPMPPMTFFIYEPMGLFNGMIAPLLKLPIKGALWYQGESDTWRSNGYSEKIADMVEDWREKWGVGDFPFLFVQLANFMKANASPSESGWAELREEQRKCLLIKNTGMAVAIDVGEWNDLHPLNKKDVGERLALLARKIAYGEKDLVACGPLYRSAKLENGRVKIEFSSIGSGLAIKNGNELKHFAIAGKDKKFIWAKAEIEGDSVVVWNDEITNPAFVRYAWADNPEAANLCNKEGLPASPFEAEIL
jgi:sialate O-acetylesterase